MCMLLGSGPRETHTALGTASKSESSESHTVLYIWTLIIMTIFYMIYSRWMDVCINQWFRRYNKGMFSLLYIKEKTSYPVGSLNTAPPTPPIFSDTPMFSHAFFYISHQTRPALLEGQRFFAKWTFGAHNVWCEYKQRYKVGETAGKFAQNQKILTRLSRVSSRMFYIIHWG